MKKVLVKFLSVVLALSLVPTIAFAGPQDSFEKGDPDTYWGVLYGPGSTDANFVKSVNVTTAMLEQKGAKTLAKEVASKLKELPEGRRVIDLTNFTYCLSDNMTNYFFLSEDSKEYLRKNTDSFFKALKEEGFVPEKTIKLILGCDEESGWDCIEHYTKVAVMPDVGFTPDGDFPVIYGEKGLIPFKYYHLKSENIIQIQGGDRVNVVCDKAGVTLKNYSEQLKFSEEI